MGDPASAYQNGYVAFGDVSGDITVVNAESLSPGAPYSSFNDSAKFARNTNVLRFTPAGTSEVSTGFTTISPTTYRVFAIYANIRNNSSSTSFKLRVGILADRNYYTPSFPIAPFSGAAFPLWYHVGTLACATDPTGLAVLLTASAAAGTIDIDSIVLVNLTTSQNRVLKIIQTNDVSGTQTLTIDHSWLTRLFPLVFWQNALHPRSYEGDPAVFSAGGIPVALSMQTGGASTRDRWRAESGGSVLNHTLTLTRYLGYLSPT
jgi:hypothetical protein